jgi:hypothetical protein
LPDGLQRLGFLSPDGEVFAGVFNWHSCLLDTNSGKALLFSDSLLYMVPADRSSGILLVMGDKGPRIVDYLNRRVLFAVPNPDDPLKGGVLLVNISGDGKEFSILGNDYTFQRYRMKSGE